MDRVWVGLAEVSIRRDCELELNGAGGFVWCASQAHDEGDFLKKIEEVLNFDRLDLIDLKRVSTFEECDDPPDELLEMVDRASENPKFRMYGTFYTYPHHTA
jgi:hypothetical protein